MNKNNAVVFVFVFVFVLIIIAIVFNSHKYDYFMDSINKNNVIRKEQEVKLGNYFDKMEAYVICMSDEIYKESRKVIEPYLVVDSVMNTVIPLKKFDAIKGAELGHLVNNKNILTIGALYDVTMTNSRRSHAELGTKNAIGCYLSHVTLWNKLIESNKKGFFIFESDASCYQEILTTTKKFLDQTMDNEPHILFFGNYGAALNDSIASIVKIESRFYGLHAYYITRKGAEICLKHAFPIEQQIDSFLSDLLLLSMNSDSGVEPINFYTIKLCLQNKGIPTTIQTKKVMCDVSI